jgi:bacillolysin
MVTALAVLSDGKNLYRLWDKTRGGMYTTDMLGYQDAAAATASTIWAGSLFSNATNSWGYSYPYREQAAVDAHFAVTRAWDYYRVKHGWTGLDGLGKGTINRVHYGTRYNNGFFNFDNVLSFGDGDGVMFGPTAAIDFVGHEYTHGVVNGTAKLTYVNQSGALNESLADVFGTAIEFYNGVRADYVMFEDCYTPGVAGDAARSLANPPQYGQPDHMARYVYTSSDNGGVHANSGIPNKAFYLLAVGGQHPYSKVWVTGVGRPAAEWIFFRAMRKLTSGATFSTARAATLSAAAEGYGLYSAPWYSVKAAWDAVGVQ